MLEKSKAESRRDTRSHDQRVEDLYSAFTRLKAEAISSGIKTVASAEKVLESAKVNRVYFYKKDKLKDKVSLAKYHAVKEAIQIFQSDFDNYCEDTVVNKLNKKLWTAEEQRKQISKTLIEQQQQLVTLQSDNIALKQKIRLQSDHMVDVVHSATFKVRPEDQVFSKPKIISPDTYCLQDVQFTSSDENVHRRAWEFSIDDLGKALQRPLPTRVYILVGPPCSGKSTWAETASNLYSDLHSIVIDANNLKYLNRLEWMGQINKYRYTKEVKVCAVVFLTPKHLLQSRNNLRAQSRRLDDSVLLEQASLFEFPNLLQEEFDEMIIIRSKE
jgi:predicted kinase